MKLAPALISAAAVLSLTVGAHAAPKAKAAKAPAAAVTFIPSPMAGAPISSGAIVPAGFDTFYVSGIPSNVAGGTEAQTTDVLTKLGAVLKASGYDYKDVVNMKVYLVADPATGKMDFAGMNTAFKKVFGTADEPNKPSRVTVQIAGLAMPGALVEIELTAAKAPAK
jgi:enamine deaminase RidA (YjgF/YER057c/UK114 family)